MKKIYAILITTLMLFPAIALAESIPENNEYTLKLGEIIKFNTGQECQLLNVGEQGAMVVGPGINTIQASRTNWVCDGLEVETLSTNFDEIKANRRAKLKITSSNLESYEIIQPECITKVDCPIPTCPGYKVDCVNFKCTAECPELEEISEEEPQIIKSILGDFKVECNNENDGLSKYPQPFLDQNYEPSEFSIVVGSTSPASDIMAAIDIATALSYQAKEPEEGSEGTTYVPADFTVHTKLDTEITNKNQNLILIGHPKENKFIGELMRLSDEPRHGYIRVFQKNIYTYLVVTGTDSMDRRNAAKALANYDDYNLKGDECRIVSKVEEKEEIQVRPQPGIRRNVCGNGFCETDVGENYNTCPQDCEKIVTTLQCSGCIKDKECLPYGIRLGKNGDSSYCDISKEFKPQKQPRQECSNNFECGSNVCVDNQCISGSFIQKILNWFRRIF